MHSTFNTQRKKHLSDYTDVAAYVVLVLDMYLDLHENAYELGEDLTKIVIFEHFHGEEEAEYWDCTEKLLSTKKYNKLKNELKLKAHSDWPMLNLYDRALYFYHKLKDQNIELTKDHILKIGQYTH